MFKQAGIRAGQGLQLLLQVLHGMQGRMVGRIGFPGFSHPGRGQAGKAGAQVELHRLFITSPFTQFLEPGLEVTRLQFAAIGLFRCHGVLADLQQFIRPLRPRRLELAQLLDALFQRGIDQRLRFRFVLLCTHTTEQRPDARQQGIGTAPLATHPVQRFAVHAITEAPPVVAHDLAKQVAVVGFQALGEQAAAVEGVLSEHALAPAVDGRHGRFIHPLHGNFQAIGAAWPVCFGVVVAQLQQQRIAAFQFAAEEARSLGQTSTDTLAQLLGGGIGEGHHENLWR